MFLFSLHKDRRYLILIETIILLSGGPALALVGAIPPGYRFLPAAIVVSLTSYRLFRDRWSLRSLGLAGWGWRNLSHAMQSHVILTLLSGLGLCGAAYLLNGQLEFRPLSILMIVISFTLSVLQELVFRGYLMGKMQKLNFAPWLTIMTSAVTFAFIHTFYEKHLFTFMAMCLLYGIFISYLYHRHRNLVLASASHFALNLLAVSLGLI